MEEENVQPNEVQQEEVGQADLIKNLKAEYARKLENTQVDMASKFEALQSQLQQALQQRQPSQQQSSDDLPDDFFEMTPKQMFDKIEKSVEAKVKPVEEKLESQSRLQQAQSQINEVISKYSSDPSYKDLNRGDSEMFKAVKKHIDSMSNSDRLDPVKFELSIQRGIIEAQRAGITSNPDDFTLKSGKPSMSSKKGKDEPLNDIQNAWVQAIYGDDAIEDKELVERIKKRRRNSWKKPQTIKTTKKGKR